MELAAELLTLNSMEGSSVEQVEPLPPPLAAGAALHHGDAGGARPPPPLAPQQRDGPPHLHHAETAERGGATRGKHCGADGGDGAGAGDGGDGDGGGSGSGDGDIGCGSMGGEGGGAGDGEGEPGGDRGLEQHLLHPRVPHTRPQVGLLITTQTHRHACLRFQWDPKCDSLREQKIVAFFENLERHNGSVEEIEMSMFHGEIKRAEDPEHDLETNYFMEQVAQFGDNILRCLRKKNLKRFIVNFQVICPVDKSAAKPFATVVIDKIIQVFEVSPNFPFQTVSFPGRNFLRGRGSELCISLLC